MDTVEVIALLVVGGSQVLINCTDPGHGYLANATGNTISPRWIYNLPGYDVTGTRYLVLLQPMVVALEDGKFKP